MENNFFNSPNCMHSEINIIYQIINKGQKFTSPDNINFLYKKTREFFRKKFGNNVPNFYVKDDMFYVLDVITYEFRGRTKESPMCMPVARAFGKFKKYELK